MNNFIAENESRTRTSPRSGAPHFGDLPEKAPQPVRRSDTVHLAARNVWNTYHKGSLEVPVLQGVDAEFHRGELAAIVGQSGSGKSTLLHLLGALDKPDSGEIHLRTDESSQPARIDNVSSSKRDQLRNQQLGMVFQFYHLLPELTALENVLSPLMIREGVLQYCWNRSRHVEAAKALLKTVDLDHRLHHLPRELSGGEMQRVAIARALIGEPSVLLADEPTGNLDSATGREILRLLVNLNRERKLTIVMVTHDMAVAEHAHRVINLVEGRIEGQE
ncbi:MAG: ABC transporter ATP-binding protein [Planctomycetales bacterium]